MQLQNKHRAIVFDSDLNVWRYFYNLVTIISTDHQDKISDSLSNVETLVNTYNYHAVGFLCYDAVTSSSTHTASLPLLEFAIYSYSLTYSSMQITHTNEYKIDAWG